MTYNLGKATWNKVPDVDAINALHQSQLDALNAQLADANAENDRLNNLIKNHKCPEAKTVTVKEVATAPVSVFFNIGKSKIASRKDLQNVKALTETAKDGKFVVTGYADSKTGSASYNQKLSQKRAETVADELVKMGVSRDNIEIVAKGGVDDLTPISYTDRRIRRAARPVRRGRRECGIRQVFRAAGREAPPRSKADFRLHELVPPLPEYQYAGHPGGSGGLAEAALQGGRVPDRRRLSDRGRRLAADRPGEIPGRHEGGSRCHPRSGDAPRHLDGAVCL